MYAQDSVSKFLNDYALITPDPQHVAAAAAAGGGGGGGRGRDATRLAMLSQLNAEFENDLDWLTGQIRASTERGEFILVATHHSPTLLTTSAPIFKTPLHNSNNFGFSSPLEYLFRSYNITSMCGEGGGVVNSNVVGWICGHTHHCCNIKVFDTLVASNQRGYLAEGSDSAASYKNYNADLVITIQVADDGSDVSAFLADSKRRHIPPRNVVGFK